MALVRENNIKPEHIEEVIIGVDPGAKHYHKPISDRNHKRNIVDLPFSIPYTVANAIINRKLSFEHFDAEALKRHDVLDFQKKISFWVDPEVCFDDINKKCTAARIQIRTKDGKLYVKRVDYPKGHYLNPMTIQESIDKFWECATLLARSVPREKLEKVLDLTLNLEKVDDVGSIIRLLT